MSPQGILMEPTSNSSTSRAAANPGLISVIIPVVERADDLLAVYRAFATELEARPEDHEFLFVFDGRFTPPPELAARAAENPGEIRLLRFARPFGETAALRLGIEKSRGELLITLPAYFQVQPDGITRLLERLKTVRWRYVR